MKKNVLVVPFVLLFAPLFSHAQGLGSIVGRVTDPSGAAVASARVVATQEGTAFSRTAVTDTEGVYVIPSLRPATYNLTVEAAGFSTSKEYNISLLADQTLTVNFGLKLGTTTEIIEISGNALQADTSTSTLKQVIEQQRLVEMPLEGRNAAKLSLLVPGTVYSVNGGADQGTTKTFPGAVTISANGARQDMVSYLLDGGNYVDEYTNVNQPFPFPDALQEFSVQTSNYSAEYGQNAGAVVNVITKSGANHFHGGVFEFLRNSVFNARNFFAPITLKDMGRDQLKRNQFGGTIGGPIIHDKTFFFAGFQGTRLRNVGNPTNATVPSQADITAFTTGGGTIDPTVANLLPLLPIQPTSRSVTFVRPDKQNFNEVLGKVDHAFSQNDRLSVRYDFNYFSRAAVFVPTNILTYADGSKITNQNWLIHETHIFRPTLINDFRFSYAREKASRGPASTVPSVQSLGSMIPFQPTAHAIQQIRVNGFFSFGDNPQAAFVRNNFTWSDDVSWVKGKNNFRFGGVLERSRVDLNNLFFQPAEFSFPSLAAFLSGKLGDYSGNFAFRQGAGEFKNNRNIFAGVYAQDNYRVTRRLTLNLGLRYEPGLPWREIKGRVQQFRLSGLVANVRSAQFPNAPPGVYFPGDPGVPPYGINASLKNFAPRVGFAYDVFGDGKTSIRGGAGIFYNSRITGIINNRFVDQTPFSPQLIFSTGVVNPGTLTDPLCTLAATQTAQNCTSQANLFPAPFPPPKNSTFARGGLYLTWDSTAQKYQVPTVYNWNLAIERQLPSSVLVRAAYVGSRSTHLTETLNLDPAPFSPTGTKGTLRLNTIVASLGITPSNLFSQVQQDSQDINSTYHSLQLSAEKRITHGLTILGSYTWSKSIDDLPPGAGVTGFDTFSAQPWDDPLRHQFDRGPSDFDHTHRFVSSFVWELPGFSGSRGFLHHAFGGWQYSGLVAAQTGRPFTVLQGAELSGTGLGQDRGTLLAGVSPYGNAQCGTTPTCVSWLNKVAFATTAATLGTYGGTGKNAFRMPGKYNWDMGLSKSFTFTERWRLQFRAEFFNVFNRVNFFDEEVASGAGSQPSITNFQRLSAGAFGTFRAGQVGDPRIGQLALKLFF
ncbi:MAG: carboxypeptidase regulatory-like domain-containing protein [Candidatus Acidiferrum sp.]